MSLTRILAFFTCLLGLAGASLSVEPAPADGSTPRGALKALTIALDAGDADAVARLIHAENPQQRQWLEAMIELSSAMSGVAKQSAETFGAEGARAVVGDTAFATAAAIRQIDESTEELDGESATVRAADPDERPLKVRRIGGSWVVPVASITGDAQPDEYPPVAERMFRQAAAIKSVTADIASGKLTTPEQAAEALHRRQFEAVNQAQPPPPPATRAADS